MDQTSDDNQAQPAASGYLAGDDRQFKMGAKGVGPVQPGQVAPQVPSVMPAEHSVAPRPSDTIPDLQADPDADLIEKEWVEKAKAIVEETRGDPYQQSQDIAAMRADYMNKRYNKTLKTEQ